MLIRTTDNVGMTVAATISIVIATHNRRIHDYASWRGMLVMSGIATDAPALPAVSPVEPSNLAGPAANRHLVRSADGQAAVWVGAVDDLWSFGKAVGVGGPWKDSAVSAGQPSDPYLMTGYDRKTLTLSHQAARSLRMKIEIDLTGTGTWVEYAALAIPAGKSTVHVFPDGYQAYWLRVSVDTATTATAWLVYE